MQNCVYRVSCCLVMVCASLLAPAQASENFKVAVYAAVDSTRQMADPRVLEKQYGRISSQLQDLADDRILAPAMEPAIQSMLAHELCFDALIRPRHLPHLRIFAARHPELRIAIDHAAKPDIARNQLEPWREHMRALGQLPNVFCKLSGLVTEAGADWQIADLVPYVSHVLECFGPRRVMWGSDWPVVELASEYSRWFQAAQALTAHLPPDDAAAVFGDTAVRFYRL